jgi:uncharacterized repeat protein (TIGR01451 family)
MHKNLFLSLAISLFTSLLNAQCEDPLQLPHAEATIPLANPMDGIFMNCLGQEIVLSASGSIASADRFIESYNWNFNDYSPTQQTDVSDIIHNFDHAAIYEVELVVIDNLGCSDTTSIPVGIIGPPILFPDHTLSACIGSEASIIAEYIPVSIANTSILSSASEGPIEDLGAYSSTIQISGYPAGLNIESCEQILNVHSNIYHTWFSDLEITITCPNGTTVILVDSPNSTIAGDNLGDQGVGFDYSWSPTTTNATLLETAMNSSMPNTIPAGEYAADGDMCALVGCPVNGEWTFTINDFMSGDMGYAWGWGIDLSVYNPSYPYTFTPTIDSDYNSSHWSGDFIVSTSEDGDEALIYTETVQQQTIQFITTDNAGCTFAQDIVVDVIENPIVVITPETFTYDPSAPESQYLIGDVNPEIYPYELYWSWFPTDGLETPDSPSTLVTIPNDNTAYELTVTSPQLLGCSGSSTINFVVLELVVSGYVFHDANENGIFDTGENAIPNFPISLDLDDIYSFTDENGHFSYGNYTGQNSITIQPNASLWTATTATTFYADLTNNSPEIVTFDFGVVPTSNAQDGVSSSFSNPETFCIIESVQWFSVSNTGNTHPSGYIAYTYDPSATYITADPEPYLIEGNTLYFSYSELGYGEAAAYSVILQMPENTSEQNTLTFHLDTYVTGSTGDILFDSDSYNSPILCSYDPNDIQELNGHGELGVISPNTPLDYLIRFQNTGNAPAYTVTITDQLPIQLNSQSVQPIMASHPYIATVDENGLVTITFENINLPDSMSSPEASQGFIHFRVSQIPDLAHETIILNPANIYFDNNSPITTNDALNTVVICDNTALEIINELPLLTIPDEFTNIQWYMNGQLIPETGSNFSLVEYGSYYAIADDIYGCSHTSQVIEYTDITDGISEATENKFVFYPNPATEMIFAEIGPFMSEITIYSAEGRILEQIKNANDRVQIDCSDFSEGTYTIKIQQAHHCEYKRVMVIVR